MAARKTPQPASPAADEAQQDEAQPQPEQPQPSQPAPVEPTARGDLGLRKVDYFFPALTLPDGTVVECSHRAYGHERAEIARKCLRALAAANGVTLES